MKRLLIGCAALGAVVSTSAFAADLSPVYKAPPAPAAVPYTWTGFYGGLNAGYSWGRVPFTTTESGAPAAGDTLTPNSFIGGAQIGYNYQTGPFVLGLEADIDWRNGSDALTGLAPSGISTLLSSRQKWGGTLRPRIGVANGNWLFYGTGGLAFGSFDHRYTETGAGGVARTVADSSMETGWTAGGGIEYSPSDRWSLGLEYLYQDFGKSTLSQPGQVVGGVPFAPSSATFEDRSHLLRAKLNVKLGWDGPPVSR